MKWCKRLSQLADHLPSIATAGQDVFREVCRHAVENLGEYLELPCLYTRLNGLSFYPFLSVHAMFVFSVKCSVRTTTGSRRKYSVRRKFCSLFIFIFIHFYCRFVALPVVIGLGLLLRFHLIA